MKIISQKQIEKDRKMFADVLYNLSLSQNNNANGITEEQRGYYKGIVITTVNAIMKLHNTGWYSAMFALAFLLPADHISLLQILPKAWFDVLDGYGRIDSGICAKIAREG